MSGASEPLRGTEAVVQITSSAAGNGEFGSGFVVHQGDDAYVVTAEHAVDDVGRETVLVNGAPASVAAAGSSRGLRAIDLAVLRVDGGLTGEDGRRISPLRLRVATGPGERVAAVGFRNAKEGNLELLPVPATVGSPVALEYRGARGRAVGWRLVLDDGEAGLEHGYSGGPVIDDRTGDAVAVVLRSVGAAGCTGISVAALEAIWPEPAHPGDGATRTPPPITFRDDEERRTTLREILRGMARLLPGIEEQFPDDLRDEVVDRFRADNLFKVHTVRALFIGQTGAGKTTTINHLLGEEVFPTTGELSCTRSLAVAEHRGGAILYDSPGFGDDPRAENVTRAILGLPPVGESRAEMLRMIDITAAGNEGPASTRLPYEEFAGEITKEYYEANRTRVSFKEFSAAAAADWARGRFDFIVLIVGSGQSQGLPLPLADVVGGLDCAGGAPVRLFKVFNAAAADYGERPDELRPAPRRRLEQAIDRLAKAGVADARAWFVMDCLRGADAESLIRAFATTLPVPVLRGLHRVISRRYAGEIQAALADRLDDYAARLAALLAVFPVDHEEHGEGFLRPAIESLVVVAEYLLSDGRTVDLTAVVDDLVGALREGKRLPSFTRYRYQRRVPVEKVFVVERPESRARRVRGAAGLLAVLSRFLGWVGADRDPTGPGAATGSVEQRVVEYVVRHEIGSVLAGYVYERGGVEAIRLALSIAMALEAAYVAGPVPADRSTPPDEDHAKALLADADRTVAAWLGAEARREIEVALGDADRAPDTDAKVTIANERVYPLVKRVMGKRSRSGSLSLTS